MNFREPASILIATVITLFFFAHSARAEPSCDVLNKQWQEKYLIDFSFDERFSRNAFQCPSVESGMARALHFIDQIGDIKLRGAAKFNFYRWLKNINFQFKLNSVDGVAGSAGNGKITLNALFLSWPANSSLTVAATIVHEGRHLVSAIPHVNCHGYITGCDLKLYRNPLEGGGYNYEFAFSWSTWRKLMRIGERMKLQELARKNALHILDLDRKILDIQPSDYSDWKFR